MLSGFAEQDDWRRKYYDSLKAVEQEGRQSRAQLETLYRLVSRLCVAAQGQSPRLDEDLQRLREAVRQAVPFEQLEPLGKSIAEAVLELDAPPAGRDPEPDGAPTPLEPSTRAVLSMLLVELAREPRLAGAATAIDAELTGPMPDGRKLQLIEKVARLVMQRLSELEQSRRELELLLGQMLGQLDSFTRYIAGQGMDESERSDSTTTLNVQITDEVQAIGQSVANGADLAQIREQLRPAAGGHRPASASFPPA